MGVQGVCEPQVQRATAEEGCELISCSWAPWDVQLANVGLEWWAEPALGLVPEFPSLKDRVEGTRF